MLSTQDLYWIAGHFEGEGCFMHRRNGDLVIEVTSTDKDVIDRVQTILGFGTLTEKSLPSGKTAYRWKVTNQSNASGLMMSLLPLMGNRRKEKIIECLDAWKAKPLPRSMWTHCKHGHPLSGDNLVIQGEGKYQKRRCRKCINERQRKYRSKVM